MYAMKNFFLHSLSISALALLLASCSGTSKILPASHLEGSWDIVQVGNEVLSPDQENAPFIAFDLAQGRIWGNSGCNLINGTFQLDPQNPSALTFGPMITTMMACQNMEAETAVLQALAQVQSFRIEGEKLYLCDASGAELLSLEKDPSLAE